MTKLDECVKTVDPALIVFDSPTKGAGTPSSNFRPTNRPNHMGVDIDIKDSPVYAVEDGLVWLTLKNHKDYGNAIIIRHTANYYSLYAHLQDDGIDVKRNECVEKGDAIGTSGNTGRSTGPHLHFEVLRLPDGVEISQSGVNNKGKAATGVKSTEYRLDPSFIFSPERQSLLKVESSAAAKASLLPGAIANAAIFGMAATVWSGALGILDIWMKIIGTAALNLTATSITYLSVKSSLVSKERKKLESVRNKLGLIISSEVVAKQLARAELTGKRSANQQRKIEVKIRSEIDGAKGVASAAGTELSKLRGELSTVRGEIASVQRSASEKIRTAEDAAKKREEVEQRLAALSSRESEIGTRAQEAAEQLKGAGSDAAQAAARFEASALAREKYIHEHESSDNRKSATEVQTADEPIATTQDSTYRTIILRAGEPDDESVNVVDDAPESKMLFLKP